MVSKNTTPFEFLEEISPKKLCGYILVTDPRDTSIVWKLYLNGDRLYYATSAIAQQERLNCLWQQQKLDLYLLPSINPERCEYEQLCDWWTEKGLPESTLKKLIISLTQEVLAQVIAFEKTQIEFISEPASKAKLYIDYSWQELWEISERFNQYWLKIRPKIHSAFARLYLSEPKVPFFFKLWKQLDEEAGCAGFFHNQKLSFWLMYLPKKYSIYELGKKINVNPLNLAHQLQIFVKQGAIEVLPYARKPQNIIKQHLKTQIRPTIACIDDSKTVQKQVKMTLESVGYNVVSITDPSHSLRTVIKEKPVLILLDINMPDIDGYQLCQMLRRSRQLKDIPVIMLTGRNTAIDKLRSRMMGVVDYLTKPCTPDKLIHAIDRSIQSQVILQR